MPVGRGRERVGVCLRCGLDAAEQDDLHDEFGLAILIQLLQEPLKSRLHLRKGEVHWRLRAACAVVLMIHGLAVQSGPHGVGNNNMIGAVEHSTHLISASARMRRWVYLSLLPRF